MSSDIILETRGLVKEFKGFVAVKRVEHENYKQVISSWEREFLLFSV